MENITKINSNEIVIVSGEGTGPGTRAMYTGTRTPRAIKARLTRERCHGDRWARALQFSHTGTYDVPVWIDLETGEYV